jgi:hypothetical protein
MTVYDSEKGEGSTRAIRRFSAGIRIHKREREEESEKE